MKTILLTILLGIQFGSHKVTVIEQNDLCPNVPDLVYIIQDGLICVPSDVLFIGTFESE